MILQDTSAKNSVKLIERFMEHVKDVSIPYASAEDRVSCSAGYTEIHEADTVESLVHRADKALYKAKAEGRNKASFLPFSAHTDSADA